MRVLPSDIIIIAKKIRNGLMGANPMGLFLCLEGGVSYGVPQGFLSGADLVHSPF